MSSNGSQFLTMHEVRECARALAIMAYRFQPESFNMFYSASDIAHFLGDLPNGQISTFHVDNLTLKKAFANRQMRKALKLKFPKKFEFSLASTSMDVITEGPSAFKKGYRISFTVEVEKSCNLRDDIDGVCDYICEYYRRVEEMGTTKSSAARSESCETVEEEIDKASNCLDAPLQNNEIQLVQANIGKKRRRPKLNRIRMNLNYSKNAEKKTAIISDEDPGTTSIGNKVALLIAEAKVYTENVNGEECVSITSGFR